jgi:hypothetical protein
LKTDENRRAYYKYYTGVKQWDDAFNYDLSINTASIGFEKAADLILDYMKIRGLL